MQKRMYIQDTETPGSDLCGNDCKNTGKQKKRLKHRNRPLATSPQNNLLKPEDTGK